MNKKILIPITIIAVVVIAIAGYSISKPPFANTRNKTQDGGILGPEKVKIEKLTQEEKEILTGADERIEKYRMATANLSVVTADGQPVSDAVVEIEQTEHEFLFGSNRDYVMVGIISNRKYGTPIPSHWSEKYDIDDEQLEEYIKRFTEFANYTSLPVSWNVYEKEKGKINYTIYDSELEWLHDNGFKVRASGLVWNNHTPGWVPDDCNGIAEAIEKRIRDFMSYYKGKFDYYSVFNEPSKPFRSLLAKDKMTRCFREFGHVNFVSTPFEIAREVNPNAKLIINECCGLEKDYYDLVENLEDSNGKPLYDIIGIQSHMHDQIWSLDGLWKGLELYSVFGVPIHFTEVTILSGTPVSGEDYGMETTPEGERRQAEYVVNFYTTLFSHPSVESIQWWNLTDLGAWKDAPAGLLRKDMVPKPAYNALMDLIYNKWWTRSQTTTSKQGQTQFRGFFGDYRITVTPKDGQPRTFDIELNKKGKRNFQLVLK